MNTAIIKPQWSPLTIALMVFGFIVFWPLGLAMLAYILWGEKFGGSAEKAHGWINKQKSWCGSKNHSWRGNWNEGFAHSGNVAFDEYRKEQLQRLDEERRKLDQDAEDFREHLKNLRMARDREEFDRFMAERNSNRPTNFGDNQNGGQAF